MAFLILRRTPTGEQLVSFRLSLTMGYVDSSPFFCFDTETITEMANAAMDERHRALPHPLKVLANSPSPKDRPSTTDDDKQWKQTSPSSRDTTWPR